MRHPHSLTNSSLAAANRSPPAAAPLVRRIVPDLTQHLQKELAAHNISLMLVVSDPTDSSSSSINSMKIDWNSLTLLKKIYFVNSYKEFQRKWNTYLQLYHSMPSDNARHSATAAPELAGQQNSQS